MVRNVVIERENITRSKGKNVDQGGSTETILLSTRDIKGKGKVDKRAEHKERGKKEREEGLARKMKEKDDAEERRRKEAEEDRKEKGKLPNETALCVLSGPCRAPLQRNATARLDVCYYLCRFYLTTDIFPGRRNGMKIWKANICALCQPLIVDIDTF